MAGFWVTFLFGTACSFTLLTAWRMEPSIMAEAASDVLRMNSLPFILPFGCKNHSLVSRNLGIGANVPGEAFCEGGTTCKASNDAMQSHECKFVSAGVRCRHWHHDRLSEVRLTFQAASALSCNHDWNVLCSPRSLMNPAIHRKKIALKPELFPAMPYWGRIPETVMRFLV